MKNNKNKPWPTTIGVIIGLAVMAGSIFYGWGPLSSTTSDVKSTSEQSMDTFCEVKQEEISGMPRESIEIDPNLRRPEQSMGTPPEVEQEDFSDSDSKSTAETYLEYPTDGYPTDLEDSVDTSSEAEQEVTLAPDSGSPEVGTKLNAQEQADETGPEDMDTFSEAVQEAASKPDSGFVEVDRPQSDSEQDYEIISKEQDSEFVEVGRNLGSSAQGHETGPGQGIGTSSEAGQEANSEPDIGFVEVDIDLNEYKQNSEKRPEEGMDNSSEVAGKDDDDSDFELVRKELDKA